MTPEQIAREKIDRMFAEAGWAVVDRDHYSPEISAVAVEESLMKGNCEADYLLFINGRAVGILEAKRQEVDVTDSIVAEQAEHYTRSVPSWCQAWQNPLPLAYVSNGKELYYRDLRDPDGFYEPLKKIHSPKDSDVFPVGSLRHRRRTGSFDSAIYLLRILLLLLLKYFRATK